MSAMENFNTNISFKIDEKERQSFMGFIGAIENTYCPSFHLFRNGDVLLFPKSEREKHIIYSTTINPKLN